LQRILGSQLLRAGDCGQMLPRWCRMPDDANIGIAIAT
jgi:hypothetical protein